jgi:hypothetical protein
MGTAKNDWLGIAALACAILGTILLLMALPSFVDLLWPLAGIIPPALLVTIMLRTRRAQRVQRRCLICGFRGPMETVLYSAQGGCLTLILLMAFVVPGVIYMIWRWGAPVCPRCRSIRQAVPDQPD